MNDYKSVQDLIVKAAIYDGVFTTISPTKIDGDTLKVIFSKDDRCSATLIYLHHNYKDPEELALRFCKDALHKLIWAPYDKIKR